ncbi:MAG: hypothetical protein WC718_01455 [Phycisphaerales bacterium]|jgi:hypothetical protein
MAISRASANAIAAEEEAKINALKKRAARQAAALQVEGAPPVETVTCRVLKAGDGRISMGVHIASIGDAFYEKGETFQAPIDLATGLEDRGYVEIQDAPKSDV